MVSKIISLLFCSILLRPYFPLSSQSLKYPHHKQQLNYLPGHKIVLLGEWSATNQRAWSGVLNSDLIIDHDFKLVNRSVLESLLSKWPPVPGGYEGFENRMRADSGNPLATWIALDLDGQAITSGTTVPAAKEFGEILEKRQIKTTQRILRDFLREHPDHLDARADLLKEIRNRALRKMPTNQKEDLDELTDTKTWAPLYSEIDSAFRGDWHLLRLNFFRPDREQPETFSPMMKSVFRKHIGTVENFIGQQPTNARWWNIWAWMARSLGDYQWETFIGSLNPFVSELIKRTCPAPDVAVWLTMEAKARGDWEKVVDLSAKTKEFNGYLTGLELYEWTPFMLWGGHDFDAIEDYPEKSYFEPGFEALLRLGRQDEANKLYDEYIRFQLSSGDSATGTMPERIAKSLGMEELAKQWGTGQLIDKATHLKTVAPGKPNFKVLLVGESGNSYRNELRRIVDNINPALVIDPTWYNEADLHAIGWNGVQESHWALLDGSGRVVAQGVDLPTQYELQNLIDDLKIVNNEAIAREYLVKNPDHPEGMLGLVLAIMERNAIALNFRPPTSPSTENEDEEMWGECVRLTRKLLDYPELLIDFPEIRPYLRPMLVENSSLLQGLSTSYTGAIEYLILRMPSNKPLWYQWLFWHNQRSVIHIVEDVAISPLAQSGSFPDSMVLSAYFEECKRDNKWDKLIVMLQEPWEREVARVQMRRENNPVASFSSTAWGSMGAYPLVEALLYAGKAIDAEDVVKTWFSLSNSDSFPNLDKLINLAKELGHDRLAKEWEGKQ